MRWFEVCAAAAVSVFAFPAPVMAQAVSNADAISSNMAKLAPLAGHWSAVIDYHDRNGSVDLRGGDYRIHPALDGTYQQADVTIYHLDDRANNHGFMIMTTYDPDTKKFDDTYFYTHWAIRVTETGVFDDAKKELAINAFVPKEDGVHDETVRALWKFNADGTVEYWHWSRYDNETKSLMNFHALLTRAND